MNYYKALFTLKSSLGTPLVADTLFGHICWAIALNEGEQQIKDFLAEMNSNQPPLLISDPFPAGYWPVPTIPYLDKDNSSDVKKQNDSQSDAKIADKKFKPQWIPAELFAQFIDDVSIKSLHTIWQNHIDKYKSPEFIEATVPHVSINRLTNHPLEDGGLFFEKRTFAKLPKSDFPQFEMWISSTFPQERIAKLIELAIAPGYGKDASTGAGHLVLEQITQVKLPAANSANAIMALSITVPSESDPTIGFWRNTVRFGKLGGPWATFGQEDEKNHPFKYPLIMLQRGAVFLVDDPISKPFIGRMVDNVHPVRSEVMQYGYAMTIPVRLADSLLEHLNSEVANES